MTYYDVLGRMKDEAKQIELFTNALFLATDGGEVDKITMNVIKHAVEMNDLAWAMIRHREVGDVN